MTTALVGIGERPSAAPLAEALGEYGSQAKRVPDLYAMLDALTEALTRLGAASVEPPIGALRDPNDLARTHAAKALEAIGDKRAIGPLLAAMSDDDDHVRAWAADTLGKFGPAAPDITPLLVALAREDAENWRAGSRVAIFRALGQIGDARALGPMATAFPALKGYYGTLDGLTALEALGWQPTTDAERALWAVTHDDWQGAVALGAEAVGPLGLALEDGGDETRMAAAQALGELHVAAALDALIAALGESLNWDRWETVMSQVARYGEMAVEPLLRSLDSRNDNMRSRAARLLSANLSWLLAPSMVGPLAEAYAGEGAKEGGADYRSFVRYGLASALTDLLKRAAGEIATSDLERVMTLQNVVVGLDPGMELGPTSYTNVDVSEARRLAEDELRRRGARR